MNGLLQKESVNLDSLAKRLVAMESALAVQSEECRRFAEQLTALSMPSTLRTAALIPRCTPHLQANGVSIPSEGFSSSMCLLQSGETNQLQDEKRPYDDQPSEDEDKVVTRRSKRRMHRHTSRQLQNSVFPDAQKMIEQMTWKLTESSYDVTNFYKTEGIFQRIARSSIFENMVLLVILINVLWIAYDVDNNPSPVLADAPLVFRVMSSAFCVFFVTELFIRFMAFKHKRNWIRDPWCVFDSIIVSMMLFETYLQGSMITGLHYLRGLRLVRLIRTVRLFKYCQELMTVVRGIGSALRAMMVICLLLSVIIYLCGVAFRIVLEDTDLGRTYFFTVPAAMGTLLLDCTLSGSKGVHLIKDAYKEHFLYAFALLLFVFVSAITVMGVLTGLLVQTVKTVADMEKEERMIRCVTEDIDKVWSFISRREFVTAAELRHLSEDPDLRKLLQGIDVDPDGLRNVSYFVLEEHGLRLTLPEFKRMLLDLRGKNAAKVRDHVETRRFIRAQLAQVTLRPGLSPRPPSTATASSTKALVLPVVENSSSDTESETESEA